MLSLKYQTNGINRRGMDRLSIRNTSHVHSMVGTPLSKGRENRRRKEEDKIKLRKEVFCLAFRLTILEEMDKPASCSLCPLCAMVVQPMHKLGWDRSVGMRVLCEE